MQVTYIKLVNISDEQLIMNFVSDCLSFMSEEDFEKIAFEDLNDIEVAFTFLPDYQVENFIKTLKEHKMYISHQNITDAVLMGYAQDNDVFSKVFSDSNIDEYVLPLLENYLKNNLTKDMILDKILDKGIDSLTDIDKDILQSN